MIPFVNDVSTVDAPVGQWSQTNKITVMQRPVQSPDLNPIKNLSKQLDNKVRLHGRFRNGKELYRTVWSQIKQVQVDKLIEYAS